MIGTQTSKLEDMKETLNITEKRVLDACIAAEGQEFEGEILIENIEYKPLGITLNQLKGYIGQLIKKGYLHTIEYSKHDITYTLA